MSNHNKVEAGKGGLTTVVHNNNFEKALKIFKKMIMNDGILKEIKRRQFYEKPGEKRRREKAEARRRFLRMKNFDNLNN